MSKLAKKIAPKGLPDRPVSNKPGPRNQCWPLYGEGDLDDWAAVDSLRGTKDPDTGKIRDWRAVQMHVDSLLGIENHLDLERYRYHWRRRCDCWPAELKL